MPEHLQSIAKYYQTHKCIQGWTLPSPIAYPPLDPKRDKMFKKTRHLFHIYVFHDRVRMVTHLTLITLCCEDSITLFCGEEKHKKQKAI